MKKRERIQVQTKEEDLTTNPFTGLDLSKIQVVKKEPVDAPHKIKEHIFSEPKKGRVDIRREKTGRGGKTVTVLMGIQNPQERKELLKIIQTQNGCGGTVKEEVIEIQGDKRDEIANTLKTMGYRVVLCGG